MRYSPYRGVAQWILRNLSGDSRGATRSQSKEGVPEAENAVRGGGNNYRLRSPRLIVGACRLSARALVGARLSSGGRRAADRGEKQDVMVWAYPDWTSPQRRSEASGRTARFRMRRCRCGDVQSFVLEMYAWLH
jgi:hypothetical protein